MGGGPEGGAGGGGGGGTRETAHAAPPAEALVSGLEGTLIGSACQHVTAWPNAVATLTIDLPAWRIDPRSGMSGWRRPAGRPRPASSRYSKITWPDTWPKADSMTALPGAPALTGHGCRGLSRRAAD